MDYQFKREYRRPLKAAIFDWAGTTVDFGSFAPTAAFIKVFERRGVQIDIEHARAPMGLMKKDHLRAITQIDEVGRRWKEKHGNFPTADDVDSMVTDIENSAWRAFHRLTASSTLFPSERLAASVATGYHVT